MDLFADNSRVQIFPSSVTDEKLSFIKSTLDYFKNKSEKQLNEEITQIKNQLPIQIFPVDSVNEQLTLRPFS